MLKLSLRRKIFLGFGIIVLMLFSNALAVYFGSRRINREMTRMSEVESVNAAALGLDRDVQELRLRADRFVYSGQESQANAAKGLIRQIEKRISIAKQQQTDPEIAKLFEKIKWRVAEYAKNFDAVIVERKIREDLVNQQLPSLASRISDEQSVISDQLSRLNVSDADRLRLVRSQSAFTQADKSFLRYFENPDGELVESALAAIGESVEHLRSTNDPRVQWGMLVQSIREYERVGLRAVQATRSYLFLRNVVIAGEESEVSYYSAQLRGRSAQHRERIANELSLTRKRIQMISWGIVITAVCLSILIATRLTLLIISPISELTTTFEKLSSGDVLPDVPGTERDDEIGKMATAARIFSDQNLRTRELLDQSQQLGKQLREKADLLEATNEELDSFAYVASHDLRSPLRGIKHLAEWIEEDVRDDLSSEGAVYLDNLKGRVSKLEVLLEDLLDFSRVGRLNPAAEKVALSSLLENVVDMIGNSRGVDVRWSAQLPTLETVRPPLEQVLMNLIGNAIKHHDKGGDGWVNVECRECGDHVELAVSDNGPGIESNNFDRIFQMYQRVGDTSIEGSGMGLAIVKKQVEHFGGSITVESEINVGTTFRFTWPSAIAVSGTMPSKKAPSTSAHSESEVETSNELQETLP